jgi:hypothetical protein
LGRAIAAKMPAKARVATSSIREKPDVEFESMMFSRAESTFPGMACQDHNQDFREQLGRLSLTIRRKESLKANLYFVGNFCHVREELPVRAAKQMWASFSARTISASRVCIAVCSFALSRFLNATSMSVPSAGDDWPG